MFEHIKDVCGEDIADAMSHRLGGSRISIPKHEDFDENHFLAMALGYELAKTIVEAVATSVPSHHFHVPIRIDRRIQALLEQDGVTVGEIAERTGVHVRTVWRHKAKMRKAGRRIGDPFLPRTLLPTTEETKGHQIVRTLLLEGHSPSQIRDILQVPGSVVLTIRASLLKQGKLLC